MDSRIWKFPLEIKDVQQVEMPKDAYLLSVAEQHGQLCLWANVCAEKNTDTEMRTVEIIGTGNPIYQDVGIEREFIGTVVMNPFVWHVFART